MEYPMRVYGYNIFEEYLSQLFNIVSWVCLIFLIIAGLLNNIFYPNAVMLGIFTTALFFCFLLMSLASSGIRQNRAIIDSALFYFFLTGFAWTVTAIIYSFWTNIIVGLVTVLIALLLRMLRQQSLKARFKPRSFSLRQFETLIQISDAMIDGDGKEVLSPIETAISIDHMFRNVSAKTIAEIKTVLLLVEWLLPLLLFRPFPFTDLGTNERRALVEKVIKSKGIFRDVAKVLKLLTCAGYYGNLKGMAQVGYIPFDNRERSKGVSQEPYKYKDPIFKDGNI